MAPASTVQACNGEDIDSIAPVRTFQPGLHLQLSCSSVELRSFPQEYDHLLSICIHLHCSQHSISAETAGMPLAGQDDMLCQADAAEIAVAGQSASMQL